jgi:hypothetical protein
MTAGVASALASIAAISARPDAVSWTITLQGSITPILSSAVSA